MTRETFWPAVRLWLVQWPWTKLPERIRDRLPDPVRQWLRRVSGYTASTGRLGRGWFRLLSPPRQPAAVSSDALAYLAAHRRHLEGGPKPTLPPGISDEGRRAFLEELVHALEEENRRQLARGEVSGLRSLVSLLERGVHLTALIEEGHDAQAFHVLVGTPPDTPDADPEAAWEGLTLSEPTSCASIR